MWEDVDKGVDISGFHFQGLVLQTNFSVSLDKVESEGLTEGVLISCNSSKLSACESTDSRLFDVEADDDERGLSIEVTHDESREKVIIYMYILLQRKSQTGRKL